MDLFSHAQIKAPGTFRVIHSADWHLGKTLGELDRDEEHQRFLDWLLVEIRERDVDALIVAGDVFESAYPAQSAQRLYYSFLSELYRTTTCAAVIIAGNHDSPAQLEAPKQVLEALRVSVVGAIADDSMESIIVLPDVDDPKLVVAAVPFLRDRDLRTGHVAQTVDEIRQALVQGIGDKYRMAAEAVKPWLEKGIPTIATGHLTVAEGRRSESEREIHVGGLGAVSADMFPSDFDYVALGHLHRPQAVDAKGVIRYAGSPIPLSFGEAYDAKHVCLVDFSAGELTNCETLPVPTWRKLVQLRTNRSQLREEIAEFTQRPAELPTWVEVIVEDPVGGENLLELVREIAAGRPFEVIRVVAGTRKRSVGAGLEDEKMADLGEELLGDPRRLFQMRLDEEEGLSSSERDQIALAFRELVEINDRLKKEGQDEGS